MYDYTKEKEALREFLAGTRTAAEIKGVFSPYGIYQQKNGLFMMRLRINGGRVSRDPPPGPRGYPRNTPEAVGIGGIGKGRAEFYRFVTFGPGVLTFGAGWFIICPEARGVIRL